MLGLLRRFFGTRFTSVTAGSGVVNRVVWKYIMETGVTVVCSGATDTEAAVDRTGFFFLLTIFLGLRDALEASVDVGTAVGASGSGVVCLGLVVIGLDVPILVTTRF